MEKQLTKEIERKARKLANTVAASSGYPTYGFEYKNIILKACRKSIIDGFPLQDYFLGEIPMGDKSGVLGNHDDQGALERCGIYNLDRKVTVINGVSIAGIGGSHRYKNGDYPMLTQKESIDIAEHCPKADILISHDAAFHVMKRLDKAHCGLKGISEYISRNKPKLNICGHYHENILPKIQGLRNYLRLQVRFGVIPLEYYGCHFLTVLYVAHFSFSALNFWR